MFVRSPSLVLVALLTAAAAFACSQKTDPTQTQPSASAVTAVATPPPTPSAPPSAAPTEVASATPTPTASDSAKPTATTAPTPSGSAAPAECGTKPLPDCPLQAWMKANANPPMLTNDLPGLGKALDKIVALAPPGYTNWASIARDGSAAAKSGDMNAVKASCRTCHDQYKQKYKNEMRARKI